MRVLTNDLWFPLPTTRNSLVFNAQMGNPKSTGTKHPLRHTKPTRLGLEQHVKYILHQYGARLGGCEWIITSILVWNMLETQHQFYCHNKAKKASADDGPGLQTRSFALVPVTLLGGWHRFMPSKMQSESPTLVAITDEGNCRIGHSLLGISHKGKGVRVSIPQCVDFWSQTFFHMQRHSCWESI